MDKDGLCCSTKLDSSRSCCLSGDIDDCGQCDGDGSTCAIEVTIQLEMDIEQISDPAAFKDSFADDVAKSLKISKERKQNLAIDTKYCRYGSWIYILGHSFFKGAVIEMKECNIVTV